MELGGIREVRYRRAGDYSYADAMPMEIPAPGASGVVADEPVQLDPAPIMITHSMDVDWWLA